MSPFGMPAIFDAINDSAGGMDELEDKSSSKSVFSKSHVEFWNSIGLISQRNDSRSFPYAIENLKISKINILEILALMTRFVKRFSLFHKLFVPWFENCKDGITILKCRFDISCTCIFILLLKTKRKE